MTLITLDVSSNIKEVIDQTSIFFYQEIPYALAVSINNTLFDIRRRVVESTWQNAFNVRNTRFPGRLFRVDKISVGGPGSQLKGFKTGRVNFIQGMVYQTLPRDWTENQAFGGTKRPQRGRSIAIPKNPELMRTSTGRIAKAKKPRNITDRRDHFMIKRGGSPHLILRRDRGAERAEVVYFFKDTAKIEKRFRFYEDALETIDRVFPRHFSNAFHQATRRSPFSARG